MSRRRKKPHGDPRRAGGQIAGPGGPHDRHAVVIDAEDAVLLDYVEVAAVEPETDGRRSLPVVAVTLGGRINKTEERSTVLYLTNEDGAAGIVAQLVGLATRMDPFSPEFSRRLRERLDEMT